MENPFEVSDTEPASLESTCERSGTGSRLALPAGKPGAAFCSGAGTVPAAPGQGRGAAPRAWVVPARPFPGDWRLSGSLGRKFLPLENSGFKYVFTSNAFLVMWKLRRGVLQVGAAPPGRAPGHPHALQTEAPSSLGGLDRRPL